MTESQKTATVVNPELTLKRFGLRCLLPMAALALIVSTVLIGPFGFAAATVTWWFIQRKF